ncbi:DUF4214 domain-containing protein [Nitrosopumilus sp.]|jgi:ribosome-associated toxin RatA of RatAB toxin-antitoxin module|nr:DUF4214 domain-containing protein [Nitrosopumilus sp.]
MKRSDKIIIIFYIILGASLISVYSHFDSLYERPEIDILIPTEPIKKINFQSIVNSISQEIMYDVLTSVDEYPKILPKNILHVEILNKTDNTILAKMTFIENIIRVDLTTLHTFEPMKKHTIEILDGDAKGTIITQTFEKIDDGSADGYTLPGFKIDTSVDFNLKGVLSPIGFIPKSNLEHALHTVITEFAIYGDTKYFHSENEKIIDSLYREILLRPADNGGLKNYVTMLEDEEMTYDDIKKSLIDSDEYQELEIIKKFKALENVSPNIKHSINELYLEILLRPADDEGLIYYSSMLESNVLSIDEIRDILLNSEEAKIIQGQN